jgi:hypothetical protein
MNVFYQAMDHSILFHEVILSKKINKYKVNFMGPVTKIKNIKTDATKILRPTHFGE